MSEFFNSVGEILAGFFSGTGLSIFRIISILVGGLALISVITNIVSNIAVRNRKLDNAAASFITSVVSLFLYIVLAIVLLSMAGLDTSSLITAIAAVAVAIGVGLQDTLSSLTNGILIIFTKPFRQGDYVSIDGAEGTVKEIRLFNTKLTSPENLDVIVPNSSVINTNVINYTAMPVRRIDLYLPIPYGENVQEVQRIIMEVINADERVVKYPIPMSHIWEYKETYMSFLARAWCPTLLFWDVKFDLNDKLYDTLYRNGIRLPFSRMEMRVRPQAKVCEGELGTVSGPLTAPGAEDVSEAAMHECEREAEDELKTEGREIAEETAEIMRETGREIAEDVAGEMKAAGEEIVRKTGEELEGLKKEAATQQAEEEAAGGQGER